MNPAAVLLTSLVFTIPYFTSGQCDSLTKLPAAAATLKIYWGARYSPWRLLRTEGVRGREGARHVFSVPDSEGTVYVTVTDLGGNEGCPSNHITVNIPPTAVSPTQENAAAEWFDVAGRKIDAPRAPGVYFVRRNGQTRKAIMLVTTK